MADNAAISDHKAWLGYLQPDGLVVSAAALVDAQVILDRNAIELQQQFLEFVGTAEVGDDDVDVITDFLRFASDFLEWPDTCVLGISDDQPVPEQFILSLPEIGEELRPTLVFRDSREAEALPVLLVQILPPEVGLDAVTTGNQAGWSASAAQRFERLLRETQVPIGVLTNGRDIRLCYAPRGETAGTVTFPVAHLKEVAGRPLVAALHMLLSGYRLLAAPKEARLPALLAKSRDYQSQVSTALAGQVLEALYELLRGIQAANDSAQGELLRDVLRDDPDRIYAALLAVLMRLVFLLYSEDRGLMPGSSLYVQNYSLRGLYERLRADAERFPDTMDQRYGAWAQLITVFRAVHNGCIYPEMQMPARDGHLFDPERYPFLDGSRLADPQLPRISDGCLERVLRKLLVLGGERLSYRTLDVEEIGSVYQTIMGFGIQKMEGTSVAIVGKRKHKSEVAAPVVIDVEQLLKMAAAERPKWLKETTGHDWENQAGQEVKRANTVDALLAALEKRIARHATPHPVATGRLVLQPTDERRRTGSHYTPRKLTGPIVRKTLEPILAQLGEHPTPEQILDLKVCDPAMGSGAFLVEACRQLADALVDAWRYHDKMPSIPPDEDELLLARRLVAQRCLYGVDKNPMAVDLAKLSLWLATLARDHPFTFVDHSLRCGDALVGLTRSQIVGFTWGTSDGQLALGQGEIDRRIKQAAEARMEILTGGEWMTPAAKQQKLKVADGAVNRVRFYGDLTVAAFFNSTSPKARASLRKRYLDDVLKLLEGNAEPLLRLTEIQTELKGGEKAVLPFHWEIEFPEVFGRAAAGFDSIVGNPPFLGGKKISGSQSGYYLSWLQTATTEAGGQSDLVAYFFRRAFSLLRHDGTFGLIATNTIAQGDTRVSGLTQIRRHGGQIFAATRRVQWPGEAAVVVSTVHIKKGQYKGRRYLDGIEVENITSFLLRLGPDINPIQLSTNAGVCFKGVMIGSDGFLFEDGNQNANSLAEMRRLVEQNARNRDRIHPFIGGEEILDNPHHHHSRYVIDFYDVAEKGLDEWPDLVNILKEKVTRTRVGGRLADLPWWQYERSRPALRDALIGYSKALVHPFTTSNLAFAQIPTSTIVATPHCVFASQSLSFFCVLQSRNHEIWVRFLASSLKDDLRYTPSDCFETFPFPSAWETDSYIESIGKEYYDFRADLMIHHDEGLTKTYNRFHDPNERNPDILKLRDLHSQMDRAVLDAYGWTNIPTECGFFLDYENEEEEEENGRARRRKKPWRYRWPDEVRDEVLALLLDLNARRAEEERLAGLTSTSKMPKIKTAIKGKTGTLTIKEFE